MGSIVMNGAKIGRNSIVGAGSVITEGKEFPERSLIIGSPARVIRTLDDAQVQRKGSAAKFYVANGPRYRKGLKRIG
jgi:carbonic anhydrase/acetyltransferase-like protein (isoleucine patch superfamily)